MIKHTTCNILFFPSGKKTSAFKMVGSRLGWSYVNKEQSCKQTCRREGWKTGMRHTLNCALGSTVHSKINILQYLPRSSLSSLHPLTSYNPVHSQRNYLRATVTPHTVMCTFHETYWTFWFCVFFRPSEVKDFLTPNLL